MNLTDLQVELKSIEEYIAVLQTEIEKMKPKTEEQRTIDFKQITILAENSTVVNEDIKKMSEQTNPDHSLYVSLQLFLHYYIKLSGVVKASNFLEIPF